MVPSDQQKNGETRDLTTGAIPTPCRPGDFPVLSQTIHGKPLVYLDNAATTQKPQAVIDAVSGYYETSNANVHRGAHALSERATAEYENVREKIRRFINAIDSREIVFTSGTTDAINLVAHSFAENCLRPGNEILITEMEHHSNIVPWQLVCERTGAHLRVAGINSAGELDLDQFKTLLGPNTRLVALTHVSNALGTINPLKELIALAHAQQIPVLVDGAQAPAHLPIDMQALDCDFYAFSAHKMYGPTGVGILYGKRELLEAMPPYRGGGNMVQTVSFERTQYAQPPYRFEAGTPNIAGIAGFSATLDYLDSLSWEDIRRHEKSMIEYAHSLVATIPGMQIIGNAKSKTGIFSFTLKGIHPHDIATVLDTEGVAIRAGHHCAMPVMQRFKIAGTARASFGLYNDHTDIDKLFAGLRVTQDIFTHE